MSFFNNLFKKNTMETQIDKIKKSQRRFNEYNNLSNEQMIENYEMLRKAIFRVHNVLINIPDINYDKLDLLNGDCLLAEVNVIPYLNSKKELSYIRFSAIKNLEPLTGEYTILDITTGKYRQHGVERYSTWLATSYGLRNICIRWQSEIPSIIEAISESYMM